MKLFGYIILLLLTIIFLNPFILRILILLLGLYKSFESYFLIGVISSIAIISYLNYRIYKNLKVNSKLDELISIKFIIILDFVILVLNVFLALLSPFIQSSPFFHLSFYAPEKIMSIVFFYLLYRKINNLQFLFCGIIEFIDLVVIMIIENPLLEEINFHLYDFIIFFNPLIDVVSTNSNYFSIVLDLFFVLFLLSGIFESNLVERVKDRFKFFGLFFIFKYIILNILYNFDFDFLQNNYLYYFLLITLSSFHLGFKYFTFWNFSKNDIIQN